MYYCIIYLWNKLKLKYIKTKGKIPASLQWMPIYVVEICDALLPTFSFAPKSTARRIIIITIIIILACI